MMREHFPYMAAALLFGVLGANDPLLFILMAALILLWIPVVYGLDRQEDAYADEQEFELQKIKHHDMIGAHRRHKRK